MIIDFERNFSKIKRKVLNENNRIYGESKKNNKVKLRTLLKESELVVLNEMDHRISSLPIVVNIDTEDEIDKGNDIKVLPNGRIKVIDQISNKSSEITYDAITQGVKDNVGEDFFLKFGRPEIDNTTSRVIFKFKRVRLLTKDRFVIEGECRTSRSPNPLGSKKPMYIQIDYKFKEQKFYEAVYCANGTVRDSRELKLRYNGIDGIENVKTAMNLIQFLTMCLYSVEDGIATINNK